MIREIVLDTETTGLNPALDRVIEIGCVELVNHVPSGRTFQVYLNPERAIHSEAELVHGITAEFLKDKPRFREIAGEFVEFVGDARLIAHNAAFDLSFLNAEFARIDRPLLAESRVVDSLALARRQNPSGQNSLDSLCSRFGIDTSRRTLHGALLDANLLAEVYIELIGGRQPSFGLGEAEVAIETVIAYEAMAAAQRPMPLPARLGSEEIAAHSALVSGFATRALWFTYQPVAEAAE